MYSPLERVLNSIFRNIQLTFIHLGRPILITLFFLVIVFAIMLIKYKKNIKEQINKELLIKLSKYLTTILYISFLLEITLFIRIGIPQNEPFSEVWTGWNMFNTSKTMYVDFTPIINILMFFPVAFILRFLFSKKKMLLPISTAIAFCSSLIIEFSQVVFHLGTLQVSDIVFNTFGGCLGALFIIVLKKIATKNTV